jgi:hypothetical protein
LKLTFAQHQDDLQLRAFSRATHGNRFEAPPPKFQPDGAFALRI